MNPGEGPCGRLFDEDLPATGLHGPEPSSCRLRNGFSFAHKATDANRPLPQDATHTESARCAA